MPCDLLFCLELEEPRKRHSRMIDKALHEEKRRFRRQVKILLLGAGESGKSTFVKQIRIMHGDSFSDHALKDFVITIRQNIIMGMKVLLDARRKLGIPWKDPLHEAQARRFFNCDVQMAVEDDHFMAVSSIICSLWQDSALKLVFERRREFQLGDSIKYFLVELPRIGLKVNCRHQENVQLFNANSRPLLVSWVHRDNVKANNCSPVGKFPSFKLGEICSLQIWIFGSCRRIHRTEILQN